MQWHADKGVSRFLENSGYTGAAPFTGREPGSNGLTFDLQGRLTLCQHGDRRVSRREADGTMVALATSYEGKRLNSPNDLVLRRPGRAVLHRSAVRPARHLQGPDQGAALPGRLPGREGRQDRAGRKGSRSAERTRLLARLQNPVRRQLAEGEADLEGLQGQSGRQSRCGPPVRGLQQALQRRRRRARRPQGGREGPCVRHRSGWRARLHTGRHPARPHSHRSAHGERGLGRRRRDAVHHGQSPRAAPAHQDPGHAAAGAQDKDYSTKGIPCFHADSRSD